MMSGKKVEMPLLGGGRWTDRPEPALPVTADLPVRVRPLFYETLWERVGEEKTPLGQLQKLLRDWQGFCSDWSDPRTTPDDRARFLEIIKPKREPGNESIQLVTSDFDMEHAA